MVADQNYSFNVASTPTVQNPFKVAKKTENEPKGLGFFDKPIPVKVTKKELPRNPALLKKVCLYLILFTVANFLLNFFKSMQEQKRLDADSKQTNKCVFFHTLPVIAIQYTIR